MKVIPIAFAFDNNLVMPACICLSSLMMHANKDTFYDIFILHSEKEELDKETLNHLPQYYPNCRIQYREVDDTFDNAFEIRGITTPAYYRLVIPELIPEYDKVIYSDVDVIFRTDLSGLYAIELSDCFLAATYDWGMILGKDGRKHIEETEGLSVNDYIQSGILIMNAAKMRENCLVPVFKKLATYKYRFQDQDILNIACKYRKRMLPIQYNMTNYAFLYVHRHPEMLKQWCTDKDLSLAKQGLILHFNGQKPWKGYCVNFDIWWEYYRKSPFFDEKFYFDFFYNKLDELDRLTLWKRIKILVRYFIYGKK